MDSGRAAHWQEAWQRAGLATAQRRPGRRKFYALTAYPGTSGFLHVGHLRGYAFADALHRFHRMLGEQVFFPFGVHASGLPPVAWAQKVRDRDPATLRSLEEARVPPNERARLEDPEAAARFLGATYPPLLRSIGILIDPTSYLTTIDDDYKAFVRWQFRTLHERGALVQGTHFASVCPVCGPVAVDAAETDLSSGGDAEVVTYATVPFALEDGRILLAATLRPETVYGVTNVWVSVGGTLTVWHHGDRSYLVAPDAAERLVEQHGGHVGHAVPASEVTGLEVRVPLRADRVPVVESALVDPRVGTGIVMSVPAHAPADAAALGDLPEALRSKIGTPRVLIEIPAGSSLAGSEVELLAGHGTPAERALRAVGARGLAERGKVDAATERLYRLEYVRGRMSIPELEGILVRDARDRVAADLVATGSSFPLREFSKPVICRNGHAVMIRRVPDQWFLHYGDAAWKAETQQLAERLTTWPAEYARELRGILDWFDDRPCTRRGRWLGSPFPLDPAWTIEPIADSTFYMAYFVVRRFVAAGRLATVQLTDAFFDFVFLGRGPGEPSVERALLDEVRDEFLYWYPLDVNVGGKEHKRVHFPVFLYTHARLLPAELQPRGILVHAWITGESGTKLSKKEIGAKGGRIPSVETAIAEWGADALRLYYCSAASASQDLEWDSDEVRAWADRLREVERLARGAAGDGAGPPELDRWLDSMMHRTVGRVRAAYLAADLRSAAQAVSVEIPSLLRRYYARGGACGRATDRLVGAWIRLLAPIAPHLAEELGEGRFPGLVAVAAFPSEDEFEPSPEAESREEFLERVEEDLRAVLTPSIDRGDPPPDEVAFYVAAPWKATVEGWLREAAERGEYPSVRSVMERARGLAELTANRSEIPRYVERVGPLVRAEPPATPVNEVEALRSAEGYLARRFGFRAVAVYPESESGPHDPLGRRERARPGRPAFYLVRGSDPRPADAERPRPAGSRSDRSRP
jgi:leucyl-tRNA synthetase